MPKVKFPKLIALIILIAISSCSAEKERPNVVFFFVDDLGYTDLGFTGSKYYETPNVDSFVGEGMFFSQAYTNAANCAPTRASLMSGQYTPRHGIITVNNSARGKSRRRKVIPVKNKTVLSSEIYTMAEIFKDAGYTTCHVGKWHLGKHDTPEGPLGQGFDINIGGNHKGSPTGGYFAPYKNPALSDGPDGEFLTERLTREAIKFIKENKNRPFFLYMSHYTVHSRWEAKREDIALFKDKEPHLKHDNPVYAGMVKSMDDSFGEIMDALKKLGIEENTIVVFYSDNGGAGQVTGHEPLRGCKGRFYEGGIRVPLIVRWPGVVKPGTKCGEPVIGSDFFPTFLELTGIKSPENQIIDGKTIMPLLHGKKNLDREAIYWHFPAYLEGPVGRWRTTPVSVIRKGDWKLLYYYEDESIELYNIAVDIGEWNNLAKEQPEKVEELFSDLQNWKQEVGAKDPLGPNPEYVPYRESKTSLNNYR